jgi:putative chitinase
MSLDITDPIQDMWPTCPVELLQGIIDTSDDVFAKFEMAGNRNRIVMFMAQISAETGGGNPNELNENLSYSTTARLRGVWPSRFRDKSDGELAHLLHNPEALAEAVYSGRMGNDQPGDGALYAGKGLLQTTGKSGYALLSQFIGIDLIAHPEALLAPQTALLCAAGDFVCVAKALPYADANDLMSVSALVNVGHLVDDPNAIKGWADRQAWFRRWSEALS